MVYLDTSAIVKRYVLEPGRRGRRARRIGRRHGGLALAAAASRLFRSLLFGVPPIDPITFGDAAALFALIGLMACYVPARRATRVDPVVALRHD